jgi:hypothetical protein
MIAIGRQCLMETFTPSRTELPCGDGELCGAENTTAIERADSLVFTSL